MNSLVDHSVVLFKLYFESQAMTTTGCVFDTIRKRCGQFSKMHEEDTSGKQEGGQLQRGGAIASVILLTHGDSWVNEPN